MKLLFDQNISFKIVKKLSDNYLDSSSVKNEGLINKNDIEIWQYAKKHDFVIVTQDSDFNDLNLIYGHPPKIVWIRKSNPDTNSIAFWLEELYFELQSFLQNSNYGVFEIT